MSSRIHPILAAAVALMVWRAAIHPGTATVVRDSKSGPSNPAVEVGGHKLLTNRNDRQPPIVIQYNLTGANSGYYPWFGPYVPWPWSVFNSFFWNRHGPAAPPIGPWLNRGPGAPAR